MGHEFWFLWDLRRSQASRHLVLSAIHRPLIPQLRNWHAEQGVSGKINQMSFNILSGLIFLIFSTFFLINPRADNIWPLYNAQDRTKFISKCRMWWLDEMSSRFDANFLLRLQISYPHESSEWWWSHFYVMWNVYQYNYIIPINTHQRDIFGGVFITGRKLWV